MAKSLKNLPRLRALVATVHSLVSNPTVHVELYLHQLMPSVVTCMVAKRLSALPAEDHWSLRVQAAGTMVGVVRRVERVFSTRGLRKACGLNELKERRGLHLFSHNAFLNIFNSPRVCLYHFAPHS